MLTKKQIKNNINWLLKNASAPVQYLTYRFLLDEKENSTQVKKLWQKIKKDKQVTEIFTKQKQDGSWCAGGSWALSPPYVLKDGYTPVSPKYVTTAWILPILGYMGFDITDKRIEKACEYILSLQCNNGFIPETDKDKYDVNVDDLPNMPCRFAIIMIGLGKVGMGYDSRVKKAYDLLVKWQRDDGGWILQMHKEERNWTRSCPYSTFHATYALHTSKNKKYEQYLKRGLLFLLNHLAKKDESNLKKFFYHGHSTIHELLMLSEYDIGMTAKPIKVMIEWLLEMYHEKEGCFVYNGKPISKYSRRKDSMDSRVAKYRLYHLIEKDWLTYYLTKIALNLIKQPMKK
jgi:hypothetical protein